jgi:protein-S-isoprenylcysteine O-methyltransferase Ste14
MAEVTSAMTRNVWKNLRTVLVWLVALLIFYIGGNTDYGESWFTPESFYILSGLLVMSAGIGVYYWYKEDRPKGPTYHDCTQEEREMETSFV